MGQVFIKDEIPVTVVLDGKEAVYAATRTELRSLETPGRMTLRETTRGGIPFHVVVTQYRVVDQVHTLVAQRV